MMSNLTTIFTILFSLVAAVSALGHSGKGTAYSGPFHMDATGQNMCEFSPSSLDRTWQIYYAAMNEEDWNAAGGKDSVCGRCIVVRGVDGETASGHEIKNILVKIVDQCPSWACDKGSIDFSTTALEAITGYSWDKKSVTWDFADCNSGDAANATPAAKARAAAAAKARAAAAAKARAAAAAKARAATAAKARAARIAKAKAEKAAAIQRASVSIKSDALAALNQVADISSDAASLPALVPAKAPSPEVDTLVEVQVPARRLSRRAGM